MRNDCEQHLNKDRPRAGHGLKTGGWLLGLAVATCVIAWPWLSGRVTHPYDAKAQFLPQIQFLAHALAVGDSPAWTPNVFAGHPQIADAQSMILSPPFFLLAALNPMPTSWAMDVTLYLALLVSAAAMLLWLRDKGIAALPAFVAALSFAFGASMAWRIQHTGQVLSLAYLPIVLLFLDRALAKRSVPYGIAAGATAAFLVLGRDQIALLCCYLLVAYVVHFWWSADDRTAGFKQSLPPLSAASITGLLIITLPVLMTFLLSQDSNRPAIDLEGAGHGSLHPALFLTAIAPDVFGSSGVQQSYWGPPSPYWNNTGLYLAQNMGQLYMGAVSAILFVWGLFAGVFLRGDALFFAGALVVGVIYALGWYTPIFAWMHAWMPGVSLYRRPADATFMIGFLASVLAAYAFDGFLKTDDRQRPAIAATLFFLVAFAVLTGLALQAGRLSDAFFYIALPAALFVAAASLLQVLARGPEQTRTYAGIALAALTVGDLAYSNGPGNATGIPPGAYDVLDPATKNATIAELKARVAAGTSGTRRDRVELAGLGFHWPNASLTHGLEHTLGYNPMRLSWVTTALGAGDSVGLVEQKAFSPLYPSYRSPMANLLGLRWIATPVPIEEIDKTLKAGDLPLAARTPDAYIYENAEALPRVLFAPDAAPVNFDTLMKSGQWPRTDFTQTVLLESKVLPAAGRPPGSIAIKSYRNTQVVLEADSPQGGYAVLNDVWHPWWFATVDGQDIPVLRANAIFRAVEVPAGKHTIVLTFRPVAGALTQLRSLREN